MKIAILLKELNHTIIALIPKMNAPARVNDYRPISCCNVLFKCINKIIANRLKDSLRRLVSPNQSAFVLGRCISDNILLTQEIMHNYHLDREVPRRAFKVDIQKAYDTVDWEFLRVVLIGFGFHEQMIAWIMECVTTTRVHEASSFTYHCFCSELELINLCFVDDLFLFDHGDVNSVKVIKEALDEFKDASGLNPKDRLPVKYLGVPLVSSRLIFMDCKELIKKVQNQWRNIDGIGKQFSVHNVWESIRLRDNLVPWYDLVWFYACIPRHAFNMWLIFKQRLRTQDCLRSWEVIDGLAVVCPLCETQPDSHEHLFFDCPFSQQVWRRVQQVAGLGSAGPSLASITSSLMPIAKRKSSKSCIGKLVLAVAAYFVRAHMACHISRAVQALCLRQGLVRGLPKLKFEKDSLCSACAMGKNNGTEFVNQTLREYYEHVGISHETSVALSPQQNGVVERRNRTLIKAARTMIFIGYAPTKKAFQIYNRRTRRIVETIHVDFDELTALASEQSNVEEDNHDIEIAHMGNDSLFGMPISEVASDQSSSTVSSHTIVHPDHQIP
nr:hypothetical protein [Tanacetum cinerariifolium]